MKVYWFDEASHISTVFNNLTFFSTLFLPQCFFFNFYRFLLWLLFNVGKMKHLVIRFTMLGSFGNKFYLVYCLFTDTKTIFWSHLQNVEVNKFVKIVFSAYISQKLSFVNKLIPFHTYSFNLIYFMSTFFLWILS